MVHYGTIQTDRETSGRFTGDRKQEAGRVTGWWWEMESDLCRRNLWRWVGNYGQWSPMSRELAGRQELARLWQTDSGERRETGQKLVQHRSQPIEKQIQRQIQIKRRVLKLTLPGPECPTGSGPGSDTGHTHFPRDRAENRPSQTKPGFQNPTSRIQQTGQITHRAGQRRDQSQVPDPPPRISQDGPPGWPGLSRWNESSHDFWLNPSHVKGRVDSGETQTYRHRIDDLGERERSDKSRCQFPTLHPERSVRPSAVRFTKQLVNNHWWQQYMDYSWSGTANGSHRSMEGGAPELRTTSTTCCTNLDLMMQHGLPASLSL